MVFNMTNMILKSNTENCQALIKLPWRQQPYIANQQGWRDRDYLIAIAVADHQDTWTAAFSLAKPTASHIRR
jgi:hypothetical protein